jgi:hypothetical protein
VPPAFQTGQEGETGASGEETSGTGEPAQPFIIDLKSVRFTQGGISFRREADDLVGEMENWRLRASVRREADGSWLIAGSSSSELTLRRGTSTAFFEETPFGLSFDVLTDGEFGSLQIRSGEARLDQIALDLSGDVEGLKDPVRSVSVALTAQGVPLADLLAAMPGSARDGIPVEAEGVLALNLRIEGEMGPGHLPGVEGEVDLTGGLLTLDGKALAESLSAELSLTRGSSVQAQARATVLDGPFSVAGTVSLGGPGNMDVSVLANPDLGLLGAILEFPEGVTTGGRLDIQARVVGPLNGMEGMRFNGTLRPDLFRVTLPSLAVPITIPEGTLQLSGIRGIVENLPVALGEDRLLVSGEIGDLLTLLDPEATPRFEGSVQGPRLDLRKISAKALPDSTLTYGKVAFAKIGGRAVGNRGFEDAARELGLIRPGALPFAGNLELSLDTVIDRQGRMEGLRASVEFGPDFLRVPEAVFRRYGGEIRTAANLTMGPDPSAPFSLNLAVRDLDAVSFVSRNSSLGRFATGRLSLELDIVGTLDGFLLPDRPALVGSGSFSLAGGLTATPLTQALADFLGLESLRAPSIQDWSTSFILEGGRVGLAEATLRGAPGAPRVGGTVGLDGGLDLRSTFDLPSDRLDLAALERLGVAGELATNVLRNPEVVQAVLHIGGSVLRPTIQADPQAAALALGAAVEQEVRAEVQVQIDAQKAEAQRLLLEQQAEAQRRIEDQKQQLQNRATGFLRNLVERQDTVRVPPPPQTTVPPPRSGDTVSQDTTRPATVPPDTIRPDTVRPDTVRPDSLRPDTVRPDTVKADTVRPDTVRPDTIRPDTVHPGVIAPPLSSSPPGSARPSPSSRARTAAMTVRIELR